MTANRPPWPAVHFVGVGGHSMSGLAVALAGLGVPVSGSDAAGSARTRRAEAAGVRVRLGHDASALEGLPPGTLVVRSTDVPLNNPELAAAAARGFTVAHRSAVLQWFLASAGAPAVAVTGTHGKSTTTALCGLACLAAGADPTVFLGAEAGYLDGGNFRLGTGPVVAEADESDGSFLAYHPDVAVVTSAEPEHLEHYGGDFAAVLAAYRRFLAGLPSGGLAVLCADDGRLRELCAASPPGAEVLWYGMGGGADWTATDVEYGRLETRFRLRRRGEDGGAFRLLLPGRHNVQNALAALAVAWRLGLELPAVAEALADFGGPARRFEVLPAGAGVTVVDDYAHNPTKVAAAIAAARQRSAGRVLAVFQPHRYQRTAQLWDAFATAFRGCDALYLTDIYAPAGERPLPGIDGPSFAAHAASGSGVPVTYVPALSDVVEACASACRPDDLVLVMGAGSITGVAHALADRLRASG